jgi:hypothetical protein
MLLILSKRIRAGESSNQKLADDLEMLASESHWYVPEGGAERLAEMNDKWASQYDNLIT